MHFKNGSDDYKNNFYYSVNGGELKSLGELDSIKIEITEEDSARLWAMFEGLEIVR